MEKEEQRWDQDLEEVEEEEDSLEVRRSKVHNEGSSVESAAAAAEEHSTQLNDNGNKTNGHMVHTSESVINHVLEESVLDESKEKDGPENVAAPAGNEVQKKTEGHPKSNNCVYYDKDEGREEVLNLYFSQSISTDAILFNLHVSRQFLKLFELQSIFLFYLLVPEGIWKCQVCCWTYGTSSLCIDLIQNPNGHLHEPMYFKTLNPGGLSFNFEIEEHIEQDSGDDALGITTTNFGAQKNLNLVIDYEQEGIKKNAELSITQHSEILPEEDITNYNSSKVTEIETLGIDLADESDLEGAELDVETVLQKQNTHDLFCPNCNSCITRRVILRKRKRQIRITSEDVKRNKLETLTDSTAKDSDRQATSGQGPGASDVHLDGTSEVEDYECERGPFIFRCLSCFSIFIPTGKEFNLFQIFGDKGKKNNMEDQQIASTSLSDRGRTTAESGSDLNGNTQKTSSREHMPLSNLNDLNRTAEVQGNGDKALPSSVQQQLMHEKWIPGAGNISYNEKTMKKDAGDDVKNTLQVAPGNQPITSNVSNDVAYFQGDQSAVASTNGTPDPKGESQNDSISIYQPDGLKFLISANVSSTTQEKLQEWKPDLKIQSIHSDGMHSYELPQQKIDEKKEGIRAREQLKINKDALVLSVKEPIHDKQANKVEDLKKIIIGHHADKDTVIVVEAGPRKTTDSEVLQDSNTSAEIGTSPHLTADVDVVEQTGAGAGEAYEFEIIKSIVYGGLVESITSLGVVSSAAGGGTATLNILALAMANLIGGLLLVSHNLRQLKKDYIVEIPNQETGHVDRYKELLGRRENFVVHATVAVLSFIIFGLISPVTYAFSFQKSDDRDFKILAAAAASLLCIVLLGTGKAYVRNPPKSYFKTVGYYALLGFAASGVSYAAGELIKRLMEKFHLLQSNSPLVMPFTQTRSDASLWASY